MHAKMGKLDQESVSINANSVQPLVKKVKVDHLKKHGLQLVLNIALAKKQL